MYRVLSADYALFYSFNHAQSFDAEQADETIPEWHRSPSVANKLFAFSNQVPAVSDPVLGRPKQAAGSKSFPKTSVISVFNQAA